MNRGSGRLVLARMMNNRPLVSQLSRPGFMVTSNRTGSSTAPEQSASESSNARPVSSVIPAAGLKLFGKIGCATGHHWRGLATKPSDDENGCHEENGRAGQVR